jgi:pyridoxine kinase
MSHNNQKKIALINDFTGFGKCSITVSLPIISALKIQCCPIPTSIFSNHTAYEEYFFDDYTDKMQSYIDKWKTLDLEFEGISTGFLGDVRQIEIVEKFINDFKTDKTIIIVDPVMGDYGVKYATYTNEL